MAGLKTILHTESETQVSWHQSRFIMRLQAHGSDLLVRFTNQLYVVRASFTTKSQKQLICRTQSIDFKLDTQFDIFS